MRATALVAAVMAGPGAVQDCDAAGALVRRRRGAAAIDGAACVIGGGMRKDDRPGIGHQAEMRGVVQTDRTVRAERFRDG